MANKFCESCGTANPESSKFCEKCGKPTPPLKPNAASSPQTPPPVYKAPPPVVAPPPVYAPPPPPVRQQYTAPNTGYVPPQQQNYQQAPNQAPPPNHYQNYANRAPDTSPLSTGMYFLMIFLMGLPLIGFILLLYWSFSSEVNVNKKNFSRAILIWAIVGIAISIVFSIIFASLLSVYWSQIMDAINEAFRNTNGGISY